MSPAASPRPISSPPGPGATRGRPQRRGRWVALLLAAVSLLGLAPAAAVAAPTIVSLTFDGATSDQSVVAPMLAARNLPGTYFVNSQRVGAAGHLNWADLAALRTAGHEIGGMSATNAWLPGLPLEQVRHEVCDDRDALLARGFTVRSFAHPYRDATAETKAIVRDCGYNSARGGGGFSHDLVPPRDPYFTITPAPVNAAMTVSELDARIQATIDDGGGWTTFQIGRVCSVCGPDAMLPATLTALLDRIAARRAAGTIEVRTVGNVIAGPLQPATHLPRGETTVSLTFDDGAADNYQLKDMLAARGMNATFYVNTGRTGTSGWLTWTQLGALQAAGNEIGGHTVSHPANLTALTPAQQVAEVCNDRAALTSHGLTATSFAYPHSLRDAATEAVVAGCGYTSGRTVGGLQCDSCTYAETKPPQNVFNVQTADEVLSGTSLASLQRYVTTVEDLGGGWVPLVFHRVCATPCGSYGYSPATLASFLDWLAARRTAGTVVRTMREVVGGPVTPPPDTVAPATTATCGTSCTAWRREPLQMTLTATDAGSGVREIRYTTDGTTPTTSSPLYTQPLTLTTSTEVRFRAWDNAGNAEAVRTIAVRIDTSAPQVALTAPAAGASIRRGAKVTLAASASDGPSGVASVRFRANGATVGTDSTAPYAITWRPSTRGQFTLTAVATDVAGNAATSAARIVTVR